MPGGIKLSSNENPRGPSPAARQAIVKAALSANRYPDAAIHALREAIAAHWQVPSEMVIAGNGGDEIIQLIAECLIDPGTRTITAKTTFSQYAFATRLFDGEVATVAMNEGSFDLDAIADQIDPNTRIVFLCNPNNPTGAIIGSEELGRFVGRVPESVLIVVDEAYAEFAEENPQFGDSLALIRRHKNVVRLRTFSKAYGLAGLRVGYAIADPSVIERLFQVRQPFSVNAVAQAAALAALTDQAYVAESVKIATDGRIRLQEMLDERGIGYFPSAANFVSADFGSDAGRIVAALAERRIAVRHLASFGLPNHIRISIGLPDELTELESAIDAIFATTM